jgi:hypothetical protein
MYGVGVLRTAGTFRLQRMGMAHSRLFTDSAEERLPASARSLA